MVKGVHHGSRKRSADDSLSWGHRHQPHLCIRSGHPGSLLHYPPDVGCFRLGENLTRHSSIEFDTVEYLQAETGELPYPDDVARFLREVERLRDDVDRIGQRIDRLTRRGRAVDPL